jgi:Trk K+ transport system NAD-binding subunit
MLSASFRNFNFYNLIFVALKPEIDSADLLYSQLTQPNCCEYATVSSAVMIVENIHKNPMIMRKRKPK